MAPHWFEQLTFLELQLFVFLMQRKHKHYGMLNIPYMLNSAYISLLILLNT